MAQPRLTHTLALKKFNIFKDKSLKKRVSEIETLFFI